MDVTRFIEAVAILVCLGLMAGMMLTFTLGRRAGIRHRQKDPEGARSVSGAVEGAIFALLGLLIAFTFSGAADRFEGRRALVTDEINAIDTAWLSFYSKLPDERAEQLQSVIWSHAVETVARGVPGAVPVLIPAINQMFDSADVLLRQLREHMS